MSRGSVVGDKNKRITVRMLSFSSVCGTALPIVLLIQCFSSWTVWRKQRTRSQANLGCNYCCYCYSIHQDWELGHVAQCQHRELLVIKCILVFYCCITNWCQFKIHLLSTFFVDQSSKHRMVGLSAQGFTKLNATCGQDHGFHLALRLFLWAHRLWEEFFS